MNQITQPGLTSIDAALKLLLESMSAVEGTEVVAIVSSRGRVLVQDFISATAVAPHNNSAMDGFAVRANDTNTIPTTLDITQRIAAGQVGEILHAGEAARIFTGAPIPESADAVVMQENCTFTDTEVTVLQAVSVGENVRKAGDDIQVGAKLFTAGHRLRPQDIGVLASVGTTQVEVRRRIRVALLTTGNELVQPGTDLQPGQIYNSNYYALSALLDALGCEVVDMGVVRDDLQATRESLISAAQQADCIISTGGVSVGDEDHVKAALMELGSLAFWKLAIKPGKPLAYGKLQNAHFFGLPGNPVSAFITFCLLVRPGLLSLSGCNNVAPLRLQMPAAFSLARSGERQEYLRVVVAANSLQAPVLEAVSNQSSGVGSSLSAAAGLAIIPPYTSVAIGDNLEFIPFSELVN